VAKVRYGLVSWDWKEQIPLDQLAEVLAHIDPRLHVYDVDTNSDTIAIVVSDQHLDEDQVRAAWGDRNG
jgi:hypothetical protein